MPERLLAPRRRSLRGRRFGTAPALLLLATATVASGALSDDQPAAAPASSPRPITLADAIGWKNINAPALSPDGTWLAYRWGAEFAPSEVVVHATGNDVEMRWSAGEPPRAPMGPALPAPGSRRRRRQG